MSEGAAGKALIIPKLPIVVGVVVVGVFGVRSDAGEVKEVLLARGNRGKSVIAEIAVKVLTTD